MIEPKGFLHITISVTDLDRSLAFYRDVLGCKMDNRNPKMVFMTAGDAFFVLTQMDGHVPPNPPGLDLATTLFHHALLVEPDRLDAALDHLKAQGVDWYECTSFGHTTFPGRRHVYVKDPDGNSIELATMIPAELEAEARKATVAAT